MAYNRDSLPIIHERVLKTLDCQVIPHSFNAKLGTAIAGLSHILQGHIDFLARNMLPDSAMDEVLERWAAIWNLHRKKASKAVAIIEVRGTVGTRVPRLWHIGGQNYEVIEAGTINEKGSYSATAQCTSEGPVGAPPKHASIEITQKDIESQAEILRFTDGTVAEEDTPLRTRLLRSIASTPQGGAYLDYIEWIESIPGVRKAWVRPAYMSKEPGKVTVALVWDGSAQGVHYEAVEHLLAQLAPATALVEVFRLAEKKIDLQFSITPDTPEIRALAHAKIAEVFLEEAEPRRFLDSNGRKTTGIIPLSRISEAISAVEGERSHRIIHPGDDISVGEGEIAIYAA
jgi:uncharacterized phage protein gp47/JayE